MTWNKIQMRKSDDEMIEAQAPVIISASRSTDIPAFYSDWLINRIKEGYVKWKNPFNGVPLYVSFEKARLFVFWSKNHRPLLKHLNFLDEKGYNYYFQFTLNDYDAEKLEPNVPNIQARIETFINLSERVGKEKVIWRFDPLILTETIGVDELLRKVENIGSQLKGYTDKLVFSFADIKLYNKVQNNLRKNAIPYQEFNERTMNEFAVELQKLNENWHFELATCAEKIPLEKYGILHNKCVDDDLMIKLFPYDKVLMEFLGVKITQPDMFNPNGTIEKKRNNKDTGQRQFCGCIVSKDIGKYNTCPHLCEYCYANASRETALKNWELYKKNSNNETIKGERSMARYYFRLPQITDLTIPQQAALYETKQIALSGGPGTGKSVVSLYRHIINFENNKKSLLLTFTTTLKEYLKEQCSNSNAKTNVKTSLKGKSANEIGLTEVIIDEAQDLPISYYEGLKRIISKVSYGADDSQILYPNQSSKQSDLKALFPTNIDCVLDKNFRSTKRIMEFAKVAFPDAYIPRATIDGLSNNMGELPVMLVSGKNRWIEEERKYEISNSKQNKAIIDIIQQLTTDTQNITLLVPWKKDAIYFEQIIKDKIQDYSIYYEDDNKFPNGCEAIKNIHITTFKSAKGLEFDTVIIPNFYDLFKIDANVIIEGITITPQNKEELQKVISEILNIDIKVADNQKIIYLKIKTKQIEPFKQRIKDINGISIRTDMTWKDLYVGVTRARSNLYIITSQDIPQLNSVTDKQIL